MPEEVRVTAEQRAVEVIAQVLANGAGGCTGGCSNRPCEVDHRDAELAVQALASHNLLVVDRAEVAKEMMEKAQEAVFDASMLYDIPSAPEVAEFVAAQFRLSEAPGG